MLYGLGLFYKTKSTFAHSVFKTELKFHIFFITDYHTINIPFATDTKTT